MQAERRLLLTAPNRWVRRIRRRRPTPITRVGLGFGVALLAWLCWPGAEPPAETWPRERILHALRMVESSWMANPPDGDGGLAIGPYQIHQVYWFDAHSFEPSLGGEYQDCRQPGYAERVIDAYMRRWAAEAWECGEAEVIARIHNGGPSGAAKESTLHYWRKVRAVLEGSE